jgi:hypothetical protein
MPAMVAAISIASLASSSPLSRHARTKYLLIDLNDVSDQTSEMGLAPW